MRALIAKAVELGGLPVDDALALLLPLFEQVRAAHETGRVAPLRGIDALTVHENRIAFDPAATELPRHNRSALAAAATEQSTALDVRRGADRERDLTSGHVQRAAIDVTPRPDGGARIVAGWQRWEHLVDTHDELTDIGSLGELLAALCCGLDLAAESDAAQLARHQRNLFAIVPGLHPVIAAVASSMIAPQRAARAQDLASVIDRLSSYRDQPEDFDLDRVIAAGSAHPDRRQVVLTDLRDRLFDLTRRNPLLHFRATQRTLNLTQASVPLVLDVRSIRPAQLFTWGGPTSGRLVGGKTVELGSVVRWDDAPYAAVALDALISAARRDRAEYGQDQLRLVIAFLRWHNVKDQPEVTIPSPLVLAPVTVTKQRGVRDSYRMQLVSTDAEVNPVLRHALRELYGFTLPETIDLTDPDAIAALRSSIEQQARVSQPGVTVATVDKPRIELIRSRAQTALQSYRRRRTSAHPTIGRRQYAYSYTRPGWAPLGIQIFRDRIQRLPLPISVELGDRPAPRQAVAPDSVVEKEMFTLDTEGDTNPYSWEVDLCAVTLANFNYRTLTLVRDYEALMDEPTANPGFDELFSTAPRELARIGDEIGIKDRYLVVPADGSQLAALAQARANDNFVIQGPPGTGKSQTITNLIADYLARGKRVLFVCQKRAALDVVHARLRSQGLEEICTLIHDSQQDKKAFIHDLRETYERWLEEDANLAELEQTRAALVNEIANARKEIESYEVALTATSAGPRLIDLLDRLIALRDSAWGDQLGPSERRLLPAPATWSQARPQVDRLEAALSGSGADRSLAASALRVLDLSSLDTIQPDAAVAEGAAVALDTLRRILAVLDAGPGIDEVTLNALRRIASIQALLDLLPPEHREALLKPRSSLSGELGSAAGALQILVDQAATAANAAIGWHAPLSAGDARAALEVARRRERSMFRNFNGEWRRVRDLVAAGFAAPERRIAPTASEALTALVAKHDADAAVHASHEGARTSWGYDDLTALMAALAEARTLDGQVGAWRDALAADDALLERTAALPRLLHDFDGAVAGLICAADNVLLSDLADCLDELASASGQAAVRSAAGPLRELASSASGPAVIQALRALDATADQLEYAVLWAALTAARSSAPQLERLDGPRVAELTDRILAATTKLERLNAEVIIARLRVDFRTAVDHSQRSVSGMSVPDRELKKTWTAARRELEHEFGKVRAYKAIRQLASGEGGAVVAAMRPVWLMSPSSLSDTLPLAANFDVVIFDEASQIPIEEAVPALYRAKQVIVVGDQMQLPPTQYFQTRHNDADGMGEDDAASAVGVVLEADSFLAVSSARLPSTMLLWHYRSRYEALIQFSNAAFYEGRLATIPDRKVGVPTGSLEVSASDQIERADVRSAVDGVLERSISMIRVLDGVYLQRTNRAEATWIAELVRELLLREGEQTFGVVAFSEAQQSEIELALERLSATDPDFAIRYEAELVREDNGQGVGLFVKNLENVQGDERDIILMSVCYAPGPDGRMRMNFGPINAAGGEKRLNVIFSRARQHMVLVASIDHTAITNTYNDGANTLKNFLRYAAVVSEGDDDAAANLLAGLRERRTVTGAGARQSALADQLAHALEQRGIEVARDVGQSNFRCDLALRAPGATGFTDAVLIDHAARFDLGALDERRLVQPSALATAGWRVHHVLATEWLDRSESIVDRLVESARSR